MCLFICCIKIVRKKETVDEIDINDSIEIDKQNKQNEQKTTNR